MQTATLTPIDLFRGIIQRIAFWMTALGVSGQLPYALHLPIMARFMRLREVLTRATLLVQAGRHAPRRRSGERSPPAVRRPRQPGPLPREFGWLTTLMPQVQETRGTLFHMLDQPEMAALIEAAPSALIPPLRSLCWALRLKPPPVLARPRRPAPPPAAPEATAPETGKPETGKPAAPEPPQARPATRPQPPPAPVPDPSKTA